MIADGFGYYYEDGVHHKIKCVEATGISKGQAVAHSGWNDGENAIEVVLADNSTGVAIGIAHETLANGEFGGLISTGVEEDIESTYYEEYQEYSKTNFLRLKSMSYRFFKTVLDLIRKTHRLGKKLNIPSIIFQGTQDKIVNHYSVHRLYDKWKHPNKKIRLYENTGHNLLMDKFTHSLYQETLDFISDLIKA